MKSLYRVPTPMTTSASRASRLATGVPVEPTPPTELGWSQLQRALAGVGVGDRDAGGPGEGVAAAADASE